MTVFLACVGVALPVAGILATFVAAGAAARVWCRTHRTPAVVATAVAVATVGVGAAGLALAVASGPSGRGWLGDLGLTAKGIGSAPYGLVLGVGEFGAICFLVTVLADAAPLVAHLRLRRAGARTADGEPRRQVGTVHPRPANASASSNWLLLTRSPWAQRWPALRASVGLPAGLALVALQAWAEEVLLRGGLSAIPQLEGVAAVLVGAAVSVAALCWLPGFRLDLPTVTTVGFIAVVHTLLFAHGSGTLPLATAQLVVLLLASV